MSNFYPADHWKYTKILEQNHAALLAEFEQFNPAEWIPNKEQKISQSGLWAFVPFMSRGHRIDPFIKRCPTVELMLNTIPIFDNCTFSIMGPGAVIDPHQGHSDRHIRVHLCLKTAGHAWIQVGNERKHWQTGQVLMFQDSETHSTANPSDQDRVVLLFDIKREDFINSVDNS